MALFRYYTSVVGTEENYKNFVNYSQFLGLPACVWFILLCHKT